MPNCTNENWKMKDIVSALALMEHDGKKIVVPRFQRGKRWNEGQELTFIDSLQRGYPVGTLLFYRTNEIIQGLAVEIYTLVDGLQRSTAISGYIKKPMKYYSSDSVSEKMLSEVYNILEFTGQEIAIKSKIRSIFYNYVRELESLEGENSYNLAMKIALEIPSIKNTIEVVSELMRVLPAYMKECKIAYDIIANTEMPAVVYTGPEEDLPEIFKRINSKGTPLNAFEIYAASWPQSEKVNINNNEIVDYVLKKYDSLNDDIYKIRGYDRREISFNKSLTMFEYVFGLSKWLNYKYPILAFEIKDKDDEISTIGFELLDACLLDTKNIADLHKVLKQYDINKLERRLVESIDIIERIIAPITRFKGNSRKMKDIILYAKNQIVAMIAFLFREKYDINNLKKKEDWPNNEKRLKKQLFYYFVFDILRKEWYDGGGKVHTAINSRKYNEEITPSAWDSVLNGMFEDSLSKKEKTSVRKPTNVNIVFLNAIYLKKFSALDQLSTDKFDIEHIATKDKMKRMIVQTCPDDNLEGLPISSIANLCYLPEYQNRSKGKKTFYEDELYLNGMKLDEIEEKYSFTSSNDLDWINMEYEKGDFNDLEEFYVEFLKLRFEEQKREFYASMDIDTSLINMNKVIKIQAERNSKTIKRTIKDFPESNAGKRKKKLYEDIKRSLEIKYSNKLEFAKKTIVEGGDRQFILAYSKLYYQGKKHKYWFAYRPNILEDENNSNKYYVFACNEDNVSLVIPVAKLVENMKALNKSENGVNSYYHIVIFIDTDKNSEKKITWLLSKPKIREVDITSFKI